MTGRRCLDKLGMHDECIEVGHVGSQNPTETNRISFKSIGFHQHIYIYTIIMPLYIWKTIKTKCSVRTGLDMFFVRYVFFPNTCINRYIYITGHAGRFAGVVWSPTMKSYRSLRRLWRWFEVLKTFVKKKWSLEKYAVPPIRNSRCFFIPSGFSDFCGFLLASSRRTSQDVVRTSWWLSWVSSCYSWCMRLVLLGIMGNLWETNRVLGAKWFRKPNGTLMDVGHLGAITAIPYHTMAENKELVSMGWYIVAVINDGYNWLFLGDYTFHKWDDFLVLITVIQLL